MSDQMNCCGGYWPHHSVGCVHYRTAQTTTSNPMEATTSAMSHPTLTAARDSFRFGEWGDGCDCRVGIDDLCNFCLGLDALVSAAKAEGRREGAEALRELVDFIDGADAPSIGGTPQTSHVASAYVALATLIDNYRGLADGSGS